MMDPSDHDPEDPGLSPAARRQKNRQARREKFKAKLASIGKAVQKVNLAKLIDDMEHDQELADELENVNLDLQEEAERKAMVREATEACRAEIENHLDKFLADNPDATYEDWIQDLHPDNVTEGKIFQDMKQVDLRFYVEDSDHRLLWNRKLCDSPDRQVQARTYQLPPKKEKKNYSQQDGGSSSTPNNDDGDAAENDEDAVVDLLS